MQHDDYYKKGSLELCGKNYLYVWLPDLDPAWDGTWTDYDCSGQDGIER